jgi:DNA-binding MarR family transcriptional regulator
MECNLREKYMKKKTFNPLYILFALLVPVIVIMYFFKKGKKGIVVDRNEYDFQPEVEITPNGINQRQLKVLSYMRENGGVGKVSDMVKMFSETDRTLRRDLNKLEGLGVVKRSGSTKSVSYTLSK